MPFLGFNTEIRKIICTTNAIESLNARYRRAASASGHFPNELAALKRLYLTTLALDPSGKGRVRWSNRWKSAMNALRHRLRRPTHRRTGVAQPAQHHQAQKPLSQPSEVHRNRDTPSTSAASDNVRPVDTPLKNSSK